MTLKPADREIQEQSQWLETKAYAAIVYLCAVRLGVEQPEILKPSDALSGFIRRSRDIFNIVTVISRAFVLIDRQRVVTKAYNNSMKKALDRPLTTWFPTARERLEAREWLITLFVAMDLSMTDLYVALHTNLEKPLLKPYDAEIQNQSLYLQHKAYATIEYLLGIQTNVENPESLPIYRSYGEYVGLAGPDPEPNIVRIYDLFRNAFRLIDRDNDPQVIAFNGFDFKPVSTWFPTTEDRESAREWLETLIVAMNLDMDILDRAFPKNTTLPPEIS